MRKRITSVLLAAASVLTALAVNSPPTANAAPECMDVPAGATPVVLVHGDLRQHDVAGDGADDEQDARCG